jgi:hypothetical protein
VRDLVTGRDTTAGGPSPAEATDGVRWLSGDVLSYSRDGDDRVVDWHSGARVPAPPHEGS